MRACVRACMHAARVWMMRCTRPALQLGELGITPVADFLELVVAAITQRHALHLPSIPEPCWATIFGKWPLGQIEALKIPGGIGALKIPDGIEVLQIPVESRP